MERISIIFNMPGLEMLQVTVEKEFDFLKEAHIVMIRDCDTKVRYIIPTSMIAYMECEEIE